MKQLVNCIKILLGAAMAGCGILYFTHHCPAPSVRVVSYTDTVWKTLTLHDTVKEMVHRVESALPPSTEQVDTFLKSVPAKNTAELFLTANYYSQLYNDSLLEIQIRDTIRQNQLVWQKVQYRLKTPLYCPLPAKPTFKLYGGLEISYPVGYSAGLLLMDKSRKMYGITYGTSKTITLKYYQPLFQF